MDRAAILTAQRDSLWLIAIRVKLLHFQAKQHLHEAHALTTRSADAAARAADLEKLYSPAALASRRKVLPLRRRARGQRA